MRKVCANEALIAGGRGAGAQAWKELVSDRAEPIAHCAGATP
jgi:hypothetical protein